MVKIFPLVFGGIIAYILLILYAGTIAYMIKGVVFREPPRDTTGVVYVVTTVGGLVSALVVARLAITEPGISPGVSQNQQTEDISEQTKKLSMYLTVGYMLVWLFAGFAALIVGVMLFPNSNKTLSDIGTTWLGAAVASGYAYFGLSPRR